MKPFRLSVHTESRKTKITKKTIRYNYAFVIAIKMEDKMGDSPANTYRKNTTSMPRDIKVQATQGPRNLKQVQNTVKNAGQKLRITIIYMFEPWMDLS